MIDLIWIIIITNTSVVIFNCWYLNKKHNVLGWIRKRVSKI